MNEPFVTFATFCSKKSSVPLWYRDHWVELRGGDKRNGEYRSSTVAETRARSLRLHSVLTLCYLCCLLFKFSLFTSISDDVASLKRKGRSAKLVQLLFLFRSQSTQVLVLGMIVDFVGGLDIGA
jgi:hypothetical protein